MSKAPKRPTKRDDHRQQNEVAGTHPPESSTRKLRAAPKRKADTVLDSVSAEIPNGLEGPEGNSVSSALSERGDTPARDGSLVAEGIQNETDRRSPHSSVREEVEQPAQARTVALVDGLAPTEPNQGVASDLTSASEEPEVKANLRQESTPSPHIHDLKSNSYESGKRSSRIAPESTVQRAIRVWSPRLRTASDRVRSASGRVKVWTHEQAVRRAHESHEAQGSANPIYILAAITLGIPALLLIPLIGMNPGVQEGTFTTVLGFLLLSAFVTAVVFEIKRLVDQPSDANHH